MQPSLFGQSDSGEGPESRSIDFRVYFLKPDGNKTGAFGVHPDDLPALEQWREREGHDSLWLFADHCTLGRLHAFRPVEGSLLQRVESMGVRDHDLCLVRYETVVRAGRPQMWLAWVRPHPAANAGA